jgi:hypothetical protein
LKYAFHTGSGVSVSSLAKPVQVAGLRDNQVVDARMDFRIGEPALPVDAGRENGKLRQFNLVIGLDRVTVLDSRPLHLGQLGLERDDLPRGRRRIEIAGHAEHLLDMRRVSCAHVLELVVEVVIAIGQAQPTLTKVDDVLAGIPVVLMDDRRERRIDSTDVEARQQCRDVAFVLGGVDAREKRGEWLDTLVLNLRLVHEAVVQIADFLRLGARGDIRRFRDFFDDRLELQLGVFAQLVERAVACLVDRHLEGIEPFAVDCAIEVVLRPDGGIDVSEVEA